MVITWANLSSRLEIYKFKCNVDASLNLLLIYPPSQTIFISVNPLYFKVFTVTKLQCLNIIKLKLTQNEDKLLKYQIQLVKFGNLSILKRRMLFQKQIECKHSKPIEILFIKLKSKGQLQNGAQQILMAISNSLKDFACGCASGWTQVFVMQPFEIAKVRLINQSLKNSYYTGIFDCFKKIRSEEGLLAFYKGSLTPLLGIGAQVALQFASNGLIKRFLHSIANQQPYGPELINDEYIQSIPTLGIVFISGLLTGVPSSIVTAPVDRTRILMQLKNISNNQYKNSLQAGISLYKNYGIKGVYLGYYPTLLRQVIALSVYFSVYELGMRLLSPENEDPSQAPVFGAFLAGGLAGCSSWLFTYPIDYVKTVIQSQIPSNIQYKSAMDCAKRKYKEEGLRTFFKGFGVTMMRSFPVNGAGFFSFQVMMRLTGRHLTLHNVQHLQVF